MSFFKNFIAKDVKTGKPSYTVTAFITGFFVVNIKLIFSGMQITNTIKMSEFSGVDYAAAVAALGGIYVLRKNKSIMSDSEYKKTKKEEDNA